MSEDKPVYVGEFLVAGVFIMNAVSFVTFAVSAQDRNVAVLLLGVALVFAFISIMLPTRRFYSHVVGSIVAGLVCALSAWQLYQGSISMPNIISVPLMGWISIYLARSEKRWSRK